MTKQILASHNLESNDTVALIYNVAVSDIFNPNTESDVYDYEKQGLDREALESIIETACDSQ